MSKVPNCVVTDHFMSQKIVGSFAKGINTTPISIKKFKDFTSDFITTMSGGFGFRFTNMTLDVGFMIIGSMSLEWVFWIPTIMLSIFFVIVAFFVKKSCFPTQKVSRN